MKKIAALLLIGVLMVGLIVPVVEARYQRRSWRRPSIQWVRVTRQYRRPYYRAGRLAWRTYTWSYWRPVITWY